MAALEIRLSSIALSGSEWFDLPPELVGQILGRIDRKELINYASSSTQCALDLFLLHGPTRLRHCDDPSRFALLKHLCQALETYPRSRDYLKGEIEFSGIVIDGIDTIASVHIYTISEENFLATLFLSSHMLSRIRSIKLHKAGLTHLPGGLTGLQEVDISYCDSLETNWLPETSRHALVTLWAHTSPLVSVPPHLTKLKYLAVSECKSLAADWLPESSGTQLEELDISETLLPSVPPNLPRLKRLFADNCVALGEDWLPETSRQNLEVMILCDSSVVRIAPGLSKLRKLDVRWCDDLSIEEWLPSSSAGRLELVAASTEALAYLPSTTPVHCRQNDDSESGPYCGVFPVFGYFRQVSDDIAWQVRVALDTL